MKKYFATIITITLLLAAIPVFAQTTGPGMMESQGHMNNVPNQEYFRHMQEYMMNNFSSEMMENYGKRYKGRGHYGMTPCTANEGFSMMGHHGMMPHMMGGPGFMGGPGMMHGKGFTDLKKYETFAKETRDLRKKLHDLMFDYGEARWIPDTTMGELNKMAEEIYQLRQEIQKKLPQ